MPSVQNKTIHPYFGLAEKEFEEID